MTPVENQWRRIRLHAHCCFTSSDPNEIVPFETLAFQAELRDLFIELFEIEKKAGVPYLRAGMNITNCNWCHFTAPPYSHHCFTCRHWSTHDGVGGDCHKQRSICNTQAAWPCWCKKWKAAKDTQMCLRYLLTKEKGEESS